MTKGIAFFDFDGTITTKDTYLEFLRFAKGNLKFFTGFTLNSPYLIGYVLKLVPNQVTKERMLTYYFKDTPLEDFQKVCDQFSTEVVPKFIRPKALEEFRKLQQEGTKIIIVSASFGNWIKKWADGQGFGLIATIPEVRNNKLTGKIDGKNCHGEEKVRRIKEKFSLPEYDQVYAYGDTGGDKPMLKLATKSFYKPFR
ncbi:MAG TPA: HAD-IB family hydrolase [Flavisolibacter sp.]|nr:HAD-IB family hydrolase [Flavisolibacter sp.]